MTETEWVDRFAMELGRLGTRAAPEQLMNLGRELWRALGQVEPEAVARGEFDLWPPHND